MPLGGVLIGGSTSGKVCDIGDRIEVAIGKHRSLLWDWAVLEGPDQTVVNQGMANRMMIAMLLAQTVKSLPKLSPVWSAPLGVDRMGDLN